MLHRTPVRPSIDIDVLVSQTEVTDAEVVLATLEYVRVIETTAGVEPDHAHGWSAEGKFPVDLHWSFAGADAARFFDVLSQSTEMMTVATTRVEVPDRAATALIVALHAAQHGARVESALDDLRQALRVTEMDTWRRATGLARDAGATDAFVAGLGLVADGTPFLARLELTGAQIPARIALRLGTEPHTADGFVWLTSTPE